MSVLATLVRTLAARLPADERLLLGLDLSDSARAGAAGAEHGEDVEGAEDVGEPDWEYIWQTLLDAHHQANRLALMVDSQVSQRLFFDFQEITSTARQLRKQLDDAYSLMCTAPRVEGLALSAGDTVSMVRRKVDVARAKTVDAELAPLQPRPDPEAPTWVVDFNARGGFVATAERPGADPDVGPWKLWGTAPTAGAAAHAVSWYFLDRPPAITFSPQPRQGPYVQIDWESSRADEGLRVRDLLERRGAIYQEHLAACRAAREDLRGHESEIKQFLAGRADHLNAIDPQHIRDSRVLRPIDSPCNRDHRGARVDTVQWVPTHLVVRTRHPTWGTFSGHRNWMPRQIVSGLLGKDPEAFTDVFFSEPISLLRTPGWAGPIYQVGANGNHRVHTARMLNLPWLAAFVSVEATPPAWDMLGLLSADPDDETEWARSLDRRLRERAALIEGLIRRGVIDGELTTDDAGRCTVHCHRLPASWLLRAPEHATQVNAVYESRYPGALAQLGIPDEVGTDPAAWIAWLTSS